MKKLNIVLLCMALVLGMASVAFAEEEKAPEIKYGTNVGDNIKPLVVSTVDGSSKVEVAKLQKKTAFIMISSVCTACRKEVQELTENADKIKEKLDVFFVIVDMDPKTGAERIGPMPFPALADSEYTIGNASNMMTAPSTLIVKGGKILYTKFGYRPGQWKEYLKD